MGAGRGGGQGGKGNTTEKNTRDENQGYRVDSDGVRDEEARRMKLKSQVMIFLHCDVEPEQKRWRPM